MDSVIERYRRLYSLTQTNYIRNMMDKINWKVRLLSIRGSRGVGKTTLMLQYIQRHYSINETSVLYATLDHTYFSRHSLEDFAGDFYNRGGRHLFLDEVHRYENWSTEVKNIYDEFPDLKIVLSGSSLLNLINADADLSRRCIPYYMPGLSLREYLAMKHQIELPVIKLENLLKNPASECQKIIDRCHPLAYFNEYLANGYYPFFKEGEEEYFIRMENILDMILQIELPLLCGVEPGSVRKLKSFLAILATESPMQVDISKLATMIEMTRPTLLTHMQHLSNAHLIHLLYSDSKNVKRMQKPDKVYLENSNLLHALCLNPTVNEGTVREIFFVNQLSAAGHTVEYHKRSADFMVNGKYTLEVGGQSKDGKQIAGETRAFIAADNIEHPAGNKIPLWAFGMLY